MLEHGGRLRRAAQNSNIPLSDWLDLSTGINPHAWSVPPIDPACWQRLPEDDDGLESAAAAYYGSARLLALPGSQAAIQALPRLFAPGELACLSPLYEEHPHAWERAGYCVRRLPTLAAALATGSPIVLFCNPNNPTGSLQPRSALLAAAAQLHQRAGWLIVDEAFADAEPQESVAALAGSELAPNLLVLRSLGKFFGLAGARVGFILGATDKLASLRELLGPWALSHPSRSVASQAFADHAWQAQARARLCASSRRLAELLAPLGPVDRTALFCTLRTASVETLAEHFTRRAILTRHFPAHGLLRFGLPDGEAGWQRLSAAVAKAERR